MMLQIFLEDEDNSETDFDPYLFVGTLTLLASQGIELVGQWRFLSGLDDEILWEAIEILLKCFREIA